MCVSLQNDPLNHPETIKICQKLQSKLLSVDIIREKDILHTLMSFLEMKTLFGFSGFLVHFHHLGSSEKEKDN